MKTKEVKSVLPNLFFISWHAEKMLIFVWPTGLKRRSCPKLEANGLSASATPGPIQPPRVLRVQQIGISSTHLVAICSACDTNAHCWGRKLWATVTLQEATESAIHSASCPGNMWDSNTDASHKRILGLLCGQLGKAQVCPTLCRHPHNAGDLGKGLEVGCDGALGHSLQAFITAGLLHQRKRVKFGSFLYSEKCTK